MHKGCIGHPLFNGGRNRAFFTGAPPTAPAHMTSHLLVLLSLHHDWTISLLRTAASATSDGCASSRLSLERQGSPASFAPWPLWSGCRRLCRSRPALSVTTRWGLRLLRTRATSAGGVLLLTHARAGVDTEVESSALSSWSPAAQGGAVAAERVGVEFRESRFFFSATGSSFSEVRASSST